MTLGLTDILRMLAATLISRETSGRAATPLELKHLGARDIADLNLPPDVAGRLMAAREARDLRWKPFG